jgi:predicted aldo/keto reductase-like oxidoreductase
VQTTEGYNRKNLTAFVHRSLENLNTDTVDLLQLHCPPTEVYYRPEVFGILDDLVKALKAIEFPNVQSVQIIFNIFRQRPAGLFFAEAQKRKVGILAAKPKRKCQAGTISAALRLTICRLTPVPVLASDPDHQIPTPTSAAWPASARYGCLSR